MNVVRDARNVKTGKTAKCSRVRGSLSKRNRLFSRESLLTNPEPYP